MSFKDYLKEVLDPDPDYNDPNNWDIEILISRIKDKPELEKYVTDGQYDEIQVENIPLIVLQKTFGIEPKNLKRIKDSSDDYAGYLIDNKDGTVSLGGGA